MAKKKETPDRGKALEALGLSQADFDALDANGKKAIDSLIRQFEKLQDVSNQTKSVWDDLTNAVAGVKLNDFMSSIEYSSEDIARMVLDMGRLNDNISDAASTLNSEWIRSLNKRESKIFDLINKTTDLSHEMANALRKAVSSGNIGDFLQEQGSIGEDALKKLIASAGWKSLNKFVTSDGLRGYQEMRQELVRINQQYDLQGKKVIDIGRGLDRMLANMTASFAPDKWVGALTDFDKIIHETQKNSGIMLADSVANEQQFTKLTTQAARFGLSVQDSADMMMRLGSGLRTTNLDVLHGAAMDMAAMSSATGLSIDEVGELTSQMMLFGKTSKQVAKFSEDTMKSAYKFGVNGKKIMQDITKALPKARELGWSGGADALKAMALQAERLGQNLDELVESSKKLRTLEGSLEASADLALMGLNINPLQMLGAARKGGKEYSDMIAQLGAGIGTFNQKTGEMDFNPLDYDMLSRRAEAVGISVESLQKQIAKTAQDNQKIELLPPGLFNSLKPEEQAFLLDQMKMKDGKVIDFSINGVKDLSRVIGSDVKNAAEKIAKDKETLEKQAQQNMHFQQSVDALKGSIMSIFTYLQPIIDAATSIVQGVSDWFGKLPTTLKVAFAAGVGALTLVYSAGKQILAGYFFGQGFNRATMGGGFLGALKGLFSKNTLRGAIPSPATTAAGAGGTLAGGIPTGNQATGVSKLSEALRAMPSPAQLLALSVALVAFGAAIVGIGYGIKIAAEGLASLVTAFDGISNSGAALGAVIAVMGGFVGIIWAMVPAIGALGAVATPVAIPLLALGAAFVGIGFGINLAAKGIAEMVMSFSSLNGSVSAMVGAMVTGIAIIGGFAGIMALMAPVIGTAAIPLLALGAAFVGIGYGISLASDGISKITKSFGELFVAINNTAQSTTSLSSIALGVAALAPAMLAVGMAGLISMPGMIAASIGFGALALSLKVVAPALEKLSTITLGNLSSIGNSLLSVIPGISAFAGISLLAPLLVMGAGGLTVLAPALQSLSSVNWGALSSASQSLLNLLPGLAGFAGISVLSGLIIVGSGALYGLGLALSSFANSTVSVSGINWDSLKTMNSSLLNLIPGLLAFSAIGAVSGLLAMAAGSLRILTNSLLNIKAIDLTTLSGLGNALANNVSGLFAFSTVGIVSPLLFAAAGAFSTVGYALNSFKDVNIDSLSGVGEILSSITGSLLKFSTIAIVAPLLVAGALGLTALGYALQIAGPAFNSLESVNWNIFSTIGDSIKSAIPSLMSFSVLGILSAPLIMGAMAISTIANLLGSAVSGFELFSNVNLNGVKSVAGELPNLLKNVGSMSILDVIASPLIAGASMLAIAGTLLSGASVGFDTFSKINWNALGNSSPILANFSNSILKFSEIAGSAGSLIVGASALATSGYMLEVAAKGFQAISSVKWDGLSNMQAGINNLIPALSNLSNLTSLTAPILIGAAMLSSVGNSFNSAATGFISLSQVKWSSFNNMGSTLLAMAPGLKSFAEVGLFSGLITGTGTALMALGNGFKSLIGINFDSFKGLGQSVDLMTPSLEKFADLGFLAIPIHLASGALVTIGNAMSTVSGGIGKLTGINWESVKTAGINLGNFIPNVAEFASMKVVAASTTLSALGNSLSNSAKGFSSVADIDWNKVSAMGTSLQEILPSLSSFGLKGIFAVPGISLMNGVLSELSDTMDELSPSLDMASKSLLSMSSSLEKVKTAMKGIDASGLSNLASISDNFINSSAKVQVAATTQQTAAPSVVSGKLSVAPITVNVKINGRDLHQEIVEATAHLS